LQAVCSQVIERTVDAFVTGVALEGEQSQGGGGGNGFKSDAEDATIAVVEPACGQDAVEQKLLSLGKAWMVALAGGTQSEDGPSSGFDPGKGAFGPGPADQRTVDVVDIVFLDLVRSPLESQQSGDGFVPLGGIVSQGDTGEQHQSGRPGSLVPTGRQPIAAIRQGTVIQPGGAGGQCGSIAGRIGCQGEQGQAGGFRMGLLICRIRPTALGDCQFGQPIEGGFEIAHRPFLLSASAGRIFLVTCQPSANSLSHK
jgi:hypothetical protein